MGKSTVNPPHRVRRKYYGNYASKRTRWDHAIRKSNALKVHYQSQRETRHFDRERDRIRKRKRKIEKNSKERVRQVDQSKKGHLIGREPEQLEPYYLLT